MAVGLSLSRADGLSQIAIQTPELALYIYQNAFSGLMEAEGLGRILVDLCLPSDDIQCILHPFLCFAKDGNFSHFLGVYVDAIRRIIGITSA